MACSKVVQTHSISISTLREKQLSVLNYPKDWIQNWHHVAGIYDGKSISLFIDNKKVAEKPVTGEKLPIFPFPLNIGKNAETQGQRQLFMRCHYQLKVIFFQKRLKSMIYLQQNRT